jgi:hypothetical protein
MKEEHWLHLRKSCIELNSLRYQLFLPLHLFLLPLHVSVSLDHLHVLRSYIYLLYFTTVTQSVWIKFREAVISVEHPCGTCDQISLPVGMLLSEICGLVSVGHPLRREDGSAICSTITYWSELLRTRNHTLLSHLRLPQPGGRGSVFISHYSGTGWPSYTPGHWVPFTSPLTTRRATVEVL